MSARAARHYMAQSWAPTPVRPRSKVPLLTAWPRRRLGEADLHLFRDDRNVGLVLGEPSGGLVDVDCDWPEAAALAPAILPATDLVHGRRSCPGSHLWYRSSAGTEVFALHDASVPGRRSVVVELRAAGHMTVVPPSTHPGGEPLVWERWGEPTRVLGGELRRRVARLAAGAVLRALGWSVGDALALARRPAMAVTCVAEVGRQEAARALGAWLGVDGPPDPPRGRSAGPLPSVSRLTQSVLDRVGGVVGAGRILGLRLRDGRQPCPFHADSGPRSLQVTGPVWRCWAGCGAGNAIHLAACVLRVSYREARAQLANELGVAQVVPFSPDP